MIEPTKQKSQAKWQQFKVYSGVNEVVIVPYNEFMAKLKGKPFDKHTLRLWKLLVKGHLVG